LDASSKPHLKGSEPLAGSIDCGGLGVGHGKAGVLRAAETPYRPMRLRQKGVSRWPREAEQ